MKINLRDLIYQIDGDVEALWNLYVYLNHSGQDSSYLIKHLKPHYPSCLLDPKESLNWNKAVNYPYSEFVFKLVNAIESEGEEFYGNFGEHGYLFLGKSDDNWIRLFTSPHGLVVMSNEFMRQVGGKKLTLGRTDDVNFIERLRVLCETNSIELPYGIKGFWDV